MSAACSAASACHAAGASAAVSPGGSAAARTAPSMCRASTSVPRWGRPTASTGQSGAPRAGPLIGLTLMFVNSSTVPALDLVSSIVYAAVLPYAAIVQTLLFYDARARRAEREAPVAVPGAIADAPS